MGQKVPEGKPPAVVLINPKYPRNVAGVLRACSCYDIDQLWWTGDRVTLDVEKGERLPREERMRGYQDVEMVRYDHMDVFDRFPKGTIPIAVEVRPNAEVLLDFEHPENAVYVFGPEDGSLGKAQLGCCHRFLIIPTRHCLNLSSAVGTILYDRMLKRHLKGIEPVKAAGEYLKEDRWGAKSNMDNLEILKGISAEGLG